MRKTALLMFGIALLALGAVSHGLRAQQRDTTGTLSQQLARGEDVYFSSCVECHNADLSGGTSHSAPPLAGDAFIARWAGHSAYDLLERTRSTMPQDQPQSLADQAYLDVVAFLLSRNKVSLGEGAFDEPAARRISMK